MENALMKILLLGADAAVDAGRLTPQCWKRAEVGEVGSAFTKNMLFSSLVNQCKLSINVLVVHSYVGLLEGKFQICSSENDHIVIPEWHLFSFC